MCTFSCVQFSARGCSISLLHSQCHYIDIVVFCLLFDCYCCCCCCIFSCYFTLNKYLHNILRTNIAHFLAMINALKLSSAHGRDGVCSALTCNDANPGFGSWRSVGRGPTARGDGDGKRDLFLYRRHQTKHSATGRPDECSCWRATACSIGVMP